MHKKDCFHEKYKQIYYLTTNKYKTKNGVLFLHFFVTNFVPRVAGFLPASLQNVQIGRTAACMFCNSIISASFTRTAPEFPPQ